MTPKHKEQIRFWKEMEGNVLFNDALNTFYDQVLGD